MSSPSGSRSPLLPPQDDDVGANGDDRETSDSRSPSLQPPVNHNHANDDRENSGSQSHLLSQQENHGDGNGEDLDASVVGNDPLYLVVAVLMMALNSAYVLGFSGSIMVPLGWAGGICGLVVEAVLSLNANLLVADFHQTGRQRHVSYSDLAGHIYGHGMYKFTQAIQAIKRFMFHCRYMILAGRAMKAVYALCRNDKNSQLSHFIIIAGVVCVVFAICATHLPPLRVWLVISTFSSLVYIVIVLDLSCNHENHAYSQGSEIRSSSSDMVFNAINACTSIFCAYNTRMVPEIQVTVNPHVIENMKRALWLQFTVGLLPMCIVTFLGYGAYSSSASTYLLNNLTGPPLAMAIANIAVFLQTVIALHMSARPAYEYCHTLIKYGRVVYLDEWERACSVLEDLALAECYCIQCLCCCSNSCSSTAHLAERRSLSFLC